MKNFSLHICGPQRRLPWKKNKEGRCYETENENIIGKIPVPRVNQIKNRAEDIQRRDTTPENLMNNAYCLISKKLKSIGYSSLLKTPQAPSQTVQKEEQTVWGERDHTGTETGHEGIDKQETNSPKWHCKH